MNVGRFFSRAIRSASPGIWVAALVLLCASSLCAQIKTDPGSECEEETNLDYRIKYCTIYIETGYLFGEDLVFALLSRGNAYNDRGQQDLAIQDYTQVIKIDPKNADAFHNRGIAYNNKHEYDRAIQDFNQAIRLNGKFASAFSNRASAYNGKGEYDRAIQDYDQVIRLSPKNGDAFVNRGNVYHSKGNAARAIQDYDQAIGINAKDGGAFYNRGVAYDSKGDHARAVQDYDQAIRLNTGYSSAIKARGSTQFLLGQFSQAAADFARAAQIEPQDAYVRVWLYLAATRSGSNGRGALAAAAPMLDLAFWPGPVVELFLDRTEPAALLQAAGDPRSKERQVPVCDARFFVAEYRLMHEGGAKVARPAFQSALEICPADSIPAQVAKSELSRLPAAN